MAFSFNGSNQYMQVASAPMTAAPLSIAFWFRKSSTVVKNGVFLRASGNATNLIGIYFTTAVRGYAFASGASADFACTTTYSTNTWTHACFTTSSSSFRTIYQNGGNSANNGAPVTPAGINQIDIATFGGSTNFDGDLADLGIWNVALNASEVLSLASGYSCQTVRPQSLVFHAPLIRELIDTRAARTITNYNSATVANHPRIIL
jgi:hypothetical protein